MYILKNAQLDKTKLTCAPSKDSDQSDHSLRCPMKKLELWKFEGDGSADVKWLNISSVEAGIMPAKTKVKVISTSSVSVYTNLTKYKHCNSHGLQVIN